MRRMCKGCPHLHVKCGGCPIANKLKRRARSKRDGYPKAKTLYAAGKRLLG